MASFGSSIVRGVTRHWLKGLIGAFSAVGAIWTITEVLSAALPDVKALLDGHGLGYLIAVVVLASGTFLIVAFDPNEVSISIPTTNSTISIRFGDLFEQTDNIIVGVNEFVDSDLGHIVSQSSVHGQVIKRIYGGDQARFRLDVDSALSAIPGIPTARSHPQSTSYPIGTTFSLNNGASKLFLMVMAQTDLITAKASTSVPDLWRAMHSALDTVRLVGGQNALSLPLIGNAHAGLNISPTRLLDLLILCITHYARAQSLPPKITIVVHEDCRKAIDLLVVAARWKP